MQNPEINPALAGALAERGYDTLTSVQSGVIAEEADGRDLIVSAKTGSGKTVAFGLAMAAQLLDGERAPWTREPLALVIAPTRELAIQVSKELQWLYAPAQGQVVTCVGGMDPIKERRALAGGAHIVVGTPGRLRDHLERGALDLSALRVVVLDEADEMLDMGFREELEEILDATPDGRRTLLFSATMPRPIVALARRYQRNALRIETIGEREAHADIAYQAVAVSPTDIEHVVVNLLRLHEAETAILFCATREAVRRLHASLTERGFHAVALSGEHSQNERNNALQSLRDRRARVCVATDVAARGIDLPSVSLVIHVELPRDAEALQHRSGRTGRAGRKGVAVLIVPFRRRRNVEAMLRSARITAEWIAPPTPEQIREKDLSRLLQTLSAPIEADEEDRQFAEQLMAQLSPEAIAAALVRSLRTDLPAPEDILLPGDRDERGDAGPRAGFEGSTWFRINAGRRHNADPRWLLPLICRYGHVGRNDIGAIRVAANESYFEVTPRATPGFLKALRRATIAPEDDGLVIEPAPPRAVEQAAGPARQRGAKPKSKRVSA
ncbi:MAG: ATP-dependent RNA helicase Atu4171 [uncultured Sphingomonas sp.]|uniref:ATP-dependent RNA helicase Atu4171 n=1 Tax=uncultured Sphingomonas sp. TaxID=158754 RepID=A0A6J4TCI3_9SPHN|nr:DEAD/DEAH box helicase [uncultured Sphingomonas sp.]CAA9519011.1 MAG: ATP-dependent RNA helicase Atu4171 [uncultured Sphingomonas sp.]